MSVPPFARLYMGPCLAADPHISGWVHVVFSQSIGYTGGVPTAVVYHGGLGKFLVCDVACRTISTSRSSHYSHTAARLCGLGELVTRIAVELSVGEAGNPPAMALPWNLDEKDRSRLKVRATPQTCMRSLYSVV